MVGGRGDDLQESQRAVGYDSKARDGGFRGGQDADPGAPSGAAEIVRANAQNLPYDRCMTVSQNYYGSGSGKHPYRDVTHPVSLEDDIGIDVEIADLVELVWAAGLRTTSSCQCDEGHPAMIQFYSARDAELFLRIAARGRLPGFPFIFTPGSGWTMHVFKIADDRTYELLTAVTFPKSEIDRIESNFRSYLAHRADSKVP
jgi:hypothetical protein